MATDDDATPERDEHLLNVLDAYVRAVESGAALDRRQWLAEYPQFAAELSAFLDEQDRLMNLTEPWRAIAAGAGIGAIPGSGFGRCTTALGSKHWGWITRARAARWSGQARDPFRDR